jgi:hypothetical protein
MLIPKVHPIFANMLVRNPSIWEEDNYEIVIIPSNYSIHWRDTCKNIKLNVGFLASHKLKTKKVILKNNRAIFDAEDVTFNLPIISNYTNFVHFLIIYKSSQIVSVPVIDEKIEMNGSDVSIKWCSNKGSRIFSLNLSTRYIFPNCSTHYLEFVQGEGIIVYDKDNIIRSKKSDRTQDYFSTFKELQDFKNRKYLV